MPTDKNFKFKIKVKTMFDLDLNDKDFRDTILIGLLLG